MFAIIKRACSVILMLRKTKKAGKKGDFDWEKAEKDPLILFVVFFTEVMCELARAIIELLFGEERL